LFKLSQYVFISYAVEDRQVADAICEMLEGSGRRCWIAPRDILPGNDWGESIIDAINHSQLMVLVYSDHASRSLQIKREIERASSKGVTIIPFRIQGAPVSKSLEYYLSNAYWIDALSLPLAPHLQLLREMADRLVNTPAADATSLDNPFKESLTKPGFAMKSDFERRHRFWPRSRKAAITVVMAGIALLLAGAYLGLTHWRTAGSFEAHLNQSQVDGANGEFDRAIEELNQAIRVAPDNWLGYRARGGMYYTRGYNRSITNDFFLAITDLKKSIELNSTGDDLTWRLLGQTQMMMRAWDAAETALTTSLKINPGNVESLTARAYIYQQLRKYNSALTDLAEAVKKAPNNQQVLTALAETYFYSGNYSKAVEWYTEAISVAPNNAYLKMRRAEAYDALGKVEEAKADKLAAQKR
jgi:tetratricopeptide (TPR) repeat protein